LIYSAAQFYLSLLKFCLDGLSIVGFWTPLLLLWCYLFLPSVFCLNICLIYLVPPMLGAYIFTITISSWCNNFFVTSFVSFYKIFYLEPILHDIVIIKSALLCYNLNEISFSSLHFYPKRILKTKVSVL
jgi:hypothetical protein